MAPTTPPRSSPTPGSGPSGPGGPWRRFLTGNVLWLSTASFLNDASSEMIFPLLPLFLVGTLGAGPAFLGLVEGVAEATAAFAKLGGGWISDRVRKRRPLVSSGYGVAAVTRPLMAAATAPWHVLALRFTDRIGKGLRTAPRDALLAESVATGERGRAFGVHRAADHAGALLGPLLATAILALRPGGIRLVFMLAFLPAAVAVLVIGRVREIPPEPEDHADGGEGGREGGQRAVAAEGEGGGPSAAARAEDRGDAETPPEERSRPRLLPYLGVLLVFGLGNASDAFLLLRAGEIGVPVALIPLLWALLHASKMVWNVVGGWLADRMGPRPILVAGWLVYAGTYAGFAVADSAWQAWALFVVYGVFYGLTEPTEKVLVSTLAGSARRGRAFGAYHFAVGIAALPASLLFGALWQTLGPGVAFSVGAGLALAAAALLPLALRR